MRPLLLCALLLSSLPALAAEPTASTYLAANGRTPGVSTRPSGLQVKIVKSGFGRRMGAGDSAQIAYTAKLTDGKVIDGTTAGLPVSVQANSVLRGLGEALQTMREGDRWELTLPPTLAFGAKGGGGGAIGPDQVVIFDVTLLAVTPAARADAGSRDGLSVSANSLEQSAHWTIHP